MKCSLMHRALADKKNTPSDVLLVVLGSLDEGRDEVVRVHLDEGLVRLDGVGRERLGHELALAAGSSTVASKCDLKNNTISNQR